MLKELFGCSVVFILLLFPAQLFSINFKTACDLLNLPRECHCQRTRTMALFSSNETRLRCRQLTDVTTNHRWSSVLYDHLAFETFNDNLTVHRLVFSNIIARTLRFNAQYLILNDHTFDSGYVGQLAITNQDTYGRIHFEFNGQIFYGTTITNLYFKLIDFEMPINEVTFANSKIYSFLIRSSKFYGFTNQNGEIASKSLTKMQYDHFLEYDILLPINQKQVPNQLLDSNDESSSMESEKSVTMNVTLMTNPVYITIFTIISSINTINLTESYFPNNIVYSQTEEIELSYNKINSLNAHTFRHLRQFKGRLILRNNHIKYLHPYAFKDLLLLKTLSLAKNSIQDLSSMHFKELNQLYELDLGYNQINELNNYTFQHLYNLRILYLNHNPLEIIHSDAFSNLTQLKQIHFQGVEFIHLIDQQYLQWIWNLASLHVIHLLKTDFDLSDVAFCMLSHYNQTLFHVSHQHFCSCNIHYFNFNQRSIENYSNSISKSTRNYLRLTPICNEKETESILKQQINDSDLVFQGLEDKCDYKIMFLDCDAMTTTTTTTTTTIETTSVSNVYTDTSFAPPVLTDATSEIPVPALATWSTPQVPNESPFNNLKKLFTVLSTLLAITVGAIAGVFFWYRFKAIIKQRRKKKNLIEQQRHFNSPVLNNHNSGAGQYASSDTLGSIHSARLSGSKSHSETYVEPATLQASSLYKNIEAIDSDPVENFIDDESLHQDSTDNSLTEIPAVTQC
ncbi:unnamed protein product [Rotaria socialis]|uniref:Uncharacterized protein n=1 Tax=Rotaria socialis TaxID=392032 RepID=A0A818W213_9BILA|nr:unnamed protein product [Rotaria socialis]CAF4252349.1 unnamed protein product [Rotaria socialis]